MGGLFHPPKISQRARRFRSTSGTKQRVRPGRSRSRGPPRSHTEIAALDIGRGGEVARATAPDHAAALDRVMPVGDAGRGLDILVDRRNGLALNLDHDPFQLNRIMV